MIENWDSRIAWLVPTRGPILGRMARLEGGTHPRPLLRLSPRARAFVSVALWLGASAATAACGGSVVVVNVVEGDGGAGGSGAGSATPNSPGAASRSSSGAGAGGSPAISPQCASLPPAPLLRCSNGSVASTDYYWNGTDCLLADTCPSASGGSSGGPIIVTGGSSSGGVARGGASGPIVVNCFSAANCSTPEVCCIDLNGTSLETNCHVSCPTLPVVDVPAQICLHDAECPGGELCGTSSNALLAMALSTTGVRTCAAPEAGALLTTDASAD